MDPQEEKQILRRIIGLQMMKNGVRIVGPNEFNREIADLSKKLSIETSVLREICIPILREMFETMVAPPAPKGKGIPGHAFDPDVNHPDTGKVGD